MKLHNVEKAVICGFLIAVIAASVSGFSAFAKECDGVRSSVLRLHILANSDSKADQQLKLNVRDKILAKSATLFKAADSRAQAEADVKTQLPEIEKIAAAEIKKEGYKYTVKAQLVNMYFNTRTYGSVTLPAGYYDAVRITIGAAKGHNWWCVLFPSLCLPSANGQEYKKIGDVLTPGELCVVKNKGKPDTEIKFKSVEVYEQCRDWFKKHPLKLW